MLTHRFRTILGDIPADWDAKPLRSLISEHFAGDWGDDEGEQAVAVMRSTNFTNDGQLDFSDVATRYFPKDKAEQFGLRQGTCWSSAQVVDRSSPLVALVSSNETCQDRPSRTLCKFCGLIREKVDASFLGWALFELQRTGIVERVQQQSTQMRNLNWRDYQRLMLPWPELDEQRRIAAALKLADDAIQKTRTELDAARDLKLSLEAGLLTGRIDPQERPKAQTKAGDLPQGWSVSPLKNLAEIGSGITLNQDRAAKENACRYLTVAHVQRGAISNEDPRYLELSDQERKHRLLETGDVLVVEGHASSMEIGRAALFEDQGQPTTFQNHLFRVRADRDQVLPKFLLHVLNSERVQRHWNAVCNTSSGLNTINRRNLRNVLIQYPDTTEQQSIIDALNAAERNVTQILAKGKALEEVKRSCCKTCSPARSEFQREPFMPEAMEGPVPYTVRTLFNEETTVEREIIEHLKAAKLGWTWRSRDYLKAYRPDEREVLLLPLLREKLKALNPAVLTSDARVDAIITKLRGCRDNQQWLAWLKDGVNYKFDAAENAQDVRLIDYEDIDANDWWVTNQFSIDGKSTRRPDIVLLINGIPIVVIEAKTASRSKPDWREGAKQLGMYAEEIDQLFYTNAYGVGVNETRMMYGVPGRRLQFWLQWRDPWPHEIDEFDEMKVSLYGLFDRGNLLDFIRHFIVFVTKDGKTEKVVVRYQQYLAVKDILNRATDLTLPAEKRRGLIWHTQGSGKTLTMIYAARSLWEDPKLQQPTVILLVDREQLGDQMDRELNSTGTDNVHVAASKRDLEEKLSGDYRGVILTTVHLFEGMPKHVTKQRPNVIVMADEAHRTQERELGTYMRSALEALRCSALPAPRSRTTTTTPPRPGAT
jgi:restriction endonuclease S subunit